MYTLFERHMYSGGAPKLGTVLHWTEFRDYLLDRKIYDAYGRLSDYEIKELSAGGETWTLSAVDPRTLEPMNVEVDTSDPILVVHGDVTDGRHRRLAAIERDDEAIAAWVADL